MVEGGERLQRRDGRDELVVDGDAQRPRRVAKAALDGCALLLLEEHHHDGGKDQERDHAGRHEGSRGACAASLISAGASRYLLQEPSRLPSGDRGQQVAQIRFEQLHEARARPAVIGSRLNISIECRRCVGRPPNPPDDDSARWDAPNGCQTAPTASLSPTLLSVAGGLGHAGMPHRGRALGSSSRERDAAARAPRSPEVALSERLRRKAGRAGAPR